MSYIMYIYIIIIIIICTYIPRALDVLSHMSVYRHGTFTGNWPCLYIAMFVHLRRNSVGNVPTQQVSRKLNLPCLYISH